MPRVRALRPALLSIALIGVSCGSSADRPDPAATQPISSPQNADSEIAFEYVVPTPPAHADGPREIGLEEVLELARSNSLDIESSRELVNMADAEASMANSALLPTIGPRVTYFRHDGEAQATEGNFLDVHKQNYFAGLELRYETDPIGSWHRRSAARSRSRMRELELEDAVQRSLWRGSQLFFDLVEAHAQVEIRQRMLASAAELVAVAEAREQRGDGLHVDTLRARAHLVTSESEVARWQAEAVIASGWLRDFLVLEDPALLVPRDGSLELRSTGDAVVPLAALSALALENRPDLRAARVAVDASLQEERSAEAWVYPSFSVVGRYGGFGPDVGDLKDQGVIDLGLGWQFGAGNSASVRRAEALRRRAQVQLQQLERHTVAEVSSLWQRIEVSGSDLAAAEANITTATEARRLAQARFDAGEGLLIEVLDLESALADSESRRARAMLDQNRATYGLRLATGGDRQTP